MLDTPRILTSTTPLNIILMQRRSRLPGRPVEDGPKNNSSTSNKSRQINVHRQNDNKLGHPSSILMSSPSVHSFPLSCLNGVCTSSSSLLISRSRLPELAIVLLLSLPARLFFWNQRRFRDFVLVVSVSSFVVGLYSGAKSSGCVDSASASDNATSPIGFTLGVGDGVTSVDGVTSTNSVSRYHFLRRV